MEYTITLTIPENIYQEAKQQANRQHLSIEAVVSQRLRQLWQTTPESDTPTELLTPEEQLMWQEMEAYKALHPRLVKQYLGQYVAIYQGKLVDHDWDEEALMRRRLQNYPDAVVLVDQVELEPQHELYIPSLRWGQV
jgi:hypothetical protein